MRRRSFGRRRRKSFRRGYMKRRRARGRSTALRIGYRM